jgi:hypothetical protein
MIIGIVSVSDYGISTDEVAQRDLGNNALKLITMNDRSIYDRADNWGHGTGFTLPLVILERVFNIESFRSIFLFRHYSTFLLFYISVIFFYLLCKNIFSSWKLGLLGSVFLVLSPRIFVDSFYNPKDLPFLSAFIISIFTIHGFIENKNIKFALLHGLATGFAMSIRIIGIMIPFFTILFLIFDLILKKKQEKVIKELQTLRVLKNLLIYICATLIIFLLLMPALIPDPIDNFITIIKTMSDFPYHQYIGLYMGKIIYDSTIPWHYLLINIAIMTPIAYIVLFFIGLVYFISRFRKNLINFYRENKYIIIAILWFFIPVLYVILLSSNLYNGWRHMYFIYPAFLIIALNGLNFIFSLSQKKIKTRWCTLAGFILTVLLSFNLIFIAQIMIRQHPYQYTYYNIFAGKNLAEVKEKFLIDYWGLSFKVGLEYILKTDNREKIKYVTGEGPKKDSELILNEHDNKRLIYIDDINEADYLLDNYRTTEYKYFDQDKKVYSLIVNGGEILTVYKLR